MSSRSSRESLYSSKISPASLYAIPICSTGAVLTTVTWLTVAMLRAHSADQIPRGDSDIPVNFALLLLPAATSLLLFRYLPGRLSSRINTLLGAFITASAFLAGAESLVQRRIVLKLFGNDWGLSTVPAVVGHLPMIAALAFVSLGITISLRALFNKRPAELTARALCAVVLLLVFIGICLHWLEIQLICDCGESLPLFRMPLAGGASLVLLAISSWNLWPEGAWHKRSSEQPSVLSILSTSAFVLVATVLLLSVAALTLVQERMLASVGDSMTQTVHQRRLLVDRILADGLQRASSIRPGEFAVVVRLFDTDPNAPRTVAAAYSVSQSLIARGFSAVAIQGADRGFLAMGNFIANPSGQVDVKAPFPARLLWANGYLLNVGVPQQDKAGLAGYMVVQIPLAELEKVGPEHSPWGQLTDVDLCAPAPNSIQCFPQRFSAAPFEVEQSQATALLPVNLAIRGEQGYQVTNDLHGERVLAAYGPVGDTGMGIALRIRLSELFAPVRKRVLLASPVVGALVLLGLWAIWFRVNSAWRRVAKAEQEGPVSASEVKATPRDEPAITSTTLATQYDFPRPNFEHWVSSSPDLQILLIEVRGSIGVREPLNSAESDLLLQRVSDKIRRCVTQADTIHSSGQGEFIVALPRRAHADTAAETAGRISTALSESIMVGGREVSVSARISVADYASVEEAADAWLEHSMSDAHDASQDWPEFTQPGDREVIAEVYDVPGDWSPPNEADDREIIAEVYDIPEDWSPDAEAGERDVIAEVDDAPEDQPKSTGSDESECNATPRDDLETPTTVTEAGNTAVAARVQDLPAERLDLYEEVQHDALDDRQGDSEEQTVVPEANNTEAIWNSSAVDDWSELLDALEAEVIPPARAQDIFVDDWSELVGTTTASAEIAQGIRDEISAISSGGFLDNAGAEITAIPMTQTPEADVEAGNTPPAIDEPKTAAPATRIKAGLSLDTLIGGWLADRRARESLELEKLWSLVSPMEVVKPQSPVERVTIGRIAELINETAVVEKQQKSQSEQVEPVAASPLEPDAPVLDSKDSPTVPLASAPEPIEEPQEPSETPLEPVVSASPEIFGAALEPVAPAPASSLPPNVERFERADPRRESIALSVAAIPVREGRIVLFAAAVGSFLLGLMFSWFTDSRPGRGRSKHKED